MSANADSARAVGFIPGYEFPVLYLGRGSDGRTPTRSQLDVHVQHEVRLVGDRRLVVQANVLNLFNQQAAINRFSWQLEPGAAVDVTPEQFFRGVDIQALRYLPQRPMRT
ncbi:MAG TPA: hypothetical protein VFM88_21715 [Vicinamibacteria bacterium]|nr:hypothetical protein [Vicinamibacteria bacterium]